MDDVSHPSGAGDQARPPVDIAVPHLAGLGIAVIAGSDEWTAQALLECSDIGFLQDGIWSAHSGHSQVCHGSLLHLVRPRATLCPFTLPGSPGSFSSSPNHHMPRNHCANVGMSSVAPSAIM